MAWIPVDFVSGFCCMLGLSLSRTLGFKLFVCLILMIRSDAVFRRDGFVNLRENEYDRNNSKVRRYPF